MAVTKEQADKVQRLAKENAVFASLVLANATAAFRQLGVEPSEDDLLALPSENAPDRDLVRGLIAQLKAGRSDLAEAQVLKDTVLPTTLAALVGPKAPSGPPDLSISVSLDLLRRSISDFSARTISGKPFKNAVEHEWWKLNLVGRDLAMELVDGELRLLARFDASLSGKLTLPRAAVRLDDMGFALVADIDPAYAQDGKFPDDVAGQLYLSVMKGRIRLRGLALPKYASESLAIALTDLLPFVPLCTAPLAIETPAASVLASKREKATLSEASVAGNTLVFGWRGPGASAAPTGRESENEKKQKPSRGAPEADFPRDKPTVDLTGSWFASHDDGPGQMVAIVHSGASVIGTYVRLRICSADGAAEQGSQSGLRGPAERRAFAATLNDGQMSGTTSVCFVTTYDDGRTSCRWGTSTAKFTLKDNNNVIVGSWYNTTEKKTIGFHYSRQSKELEVLQASLHESAEFKKLGVQSKKLAFLSVGPHDYHAGMTWVYGKLKFRAKEDDELEEVVLELVENDAVVATGELTADAKRTMLHRPFGSGERTIEFPPEGSSLALFEISADQSAVLGCDDRESEFGVTLRLRARLKGGRDQTLTFGAVDCLVRYEGVNRYGGRDEVDGGDDWVRPSVVPVLRHFNQKMLIGDISNMNGGPFQPHKFHRDGTHVDAWFEDYDKLDSSIAKRLLEFLNDEVDGSRIEVLYVDTIRADAHGFWHALQDVVLRDGRKATKVIKNEPTHADHFHLQIRPQG